MREVASRLYSTLVRPFAGRRLRRFRVVDRAHRLVLAWQRRGLPMVQGHPMYVDPQDTLDLTTMPFEPFETELVQRLLRPGDRVVDVGANIGYYTLIFARSVGPSGRVWAFEPEPANFDMLHRNVRLNDYGNVVLERAAVADRTGTLDLYVAWQSIGDHRLFDTWRDRRRIAVPCFRLDDYFAERAEPLALVKMDIQGAEPSALAGMREVLKRHDDIVLVTEYSPPLLREFGIEPTEYLRALLDLGLRLFEIHEPTRTLPEVDVADLAARYRPDTQDFTNLICLRGDLRERLA